MFWVIDSKFAYGGRSALFPLLKSIISVQGGTKKYFSFKSERNVGCKNTKAVFLRSASLITKSRKISHNKNVTFA